MPAADPGSQIQSHRPCRCRGQRARRRRSGTALDACRADQGEGACVSGSAPSGIMSLIFCSSRPSRTGAAQNLRRRHDGIPAASARTDHDPDPAMEDCPRGSRRRHLRSRNRSEAPQPFEKHRLTARPNERGAELPAPRRRDSGSRNRGPHRRTRLRPPIPAGMCRRSVGDPVTQRGSGTARGPERITDEAKRRLHAQARGAAEIQQHPSRPPRP